MYGQVEYNKDGLPICEICGQAYRKLMNHVVQKHNINSKQYKQQFGLDNRRGIICNETKQILQQHIVNNYDKVVKQNLIEGGENTRLSKGHQLNYKRSQQTINRLKQHIKNI